MLTPFDFQSHTRIVSSPGSIDQLGALATTLSTRRVLVVSDPGIVTAGHTGRGLDTLSTAGLKTELFAGVRENPTTAEVDAGLQVARNFNPDLIVGLGGGSSMDCAKGINFLYTNGGRMQDYWGQGKTVCDLLPMIAVPTTAGTGSETQSFALISDATTGAKMACGDRRAAFRIAVLDAELTCTQPALVTAITGIDAIAHAVESFVTTRRNPMSQMFSREAWRLLATNFATVVAEPDHLDARAGMQLGASFAGLAIENSMLGAAHALSNPLTARYGIPHGEAVGMMLPHVIRYNGVEFAREYRDLLECTPPLPGLPTASDGPEGLANFIGRLVDLVGLRNRLSACDIDQAALPELANEAAQQWTGGFNPRPVTAADLLDIYTAAY